MNGMAPGPADDAPPSVFICYRREETAPHAGRLYDSMVSRFGEHHVFMDVDMAPGVDFVERITEAVSGCVVLILVMGPRWATMEDEDGGTRIADPEDFVRLELETALRRPEVTPIPVLVSGAKMPRREQLPSELQPITHRNALELSDMRWSADVERLHTTLDVLLADTLETETESPPVAPPVAAPPPVEPPPVAPPPARPVALSGGMVAEGAAVGGAAAFAARLLAEAIPEGSRDLTNIANVVSTRAATWALAAAALLFWLAFRTGSEPGGPVARGLLTGAIAGAVGGAIWAAPVFLSNPNLAFNGTEASWIQVASLAVTGGMVGSLLAAASRDPRRSLGFACGAAAGAVVQLATIGLDWELTETLEIAFYFALSAAAVAALTLAVLSRSRR